MRNILFLLLTSSLSSLFAQYKHAPKDYISADFHVKRRAELIKKMPKNSVAIFFANPIRNRANDVNFIYHPDPDFYYLTGYREPNAVLVLFSEQTNVFGTPTQEVIYVQPKDEYDERWNGARLGVEGTKETLKIATVLSNEEFKNIPIDFTSFDYLLTFDPHRDSRDDIYATNDLYDLIQSFKKKANYPKYLNPASEKVYEAMKRTTLQNASNVAKVVGQQLRYTSVLRLDQNIINFLSAQDNEKRMEVVQTLPETNIVISVLDSLMSDLRQIKTQEEITLLRKAAEMSAIGQNEVMKAIQPGMSETEVQGIHEFVYKKFSAKAVGYPSIVGAGENGCMLHYISNNKPKLEDGELILMDCGAEYRGYTADVTRTIPVNGTFSKEQKQIYDIVLEAQNKCIEMCVAGKSFSEIYKRSTDIIGKGLTKLKIIPSPEYYDTYFPHGLMHHIGLDVHDKGHYQTLENNMVVTVEPGIYIPLNSDCDEKWWGIGVRIEDDILITPQGPLNLSEKAPRTTEEIEDLMKKESVFNQLVLPDLE
ncbi:aminopeptidase P N-terminal domain-containing protein [Flammeovirga yaeyamensis]|uniref:Xaa-Pro aminopeptidase n=1 Tax=Flammeovirga yaeyamensis TaxID=367791 RepID=A0AAX1N4M1_9BACT|nr:aminopeptidase P family protein [Flammeovirga yaeyamensis]MBB3700247.1 Xaa-Pro aminopeptidase [Flammeovirga yaeyamensis]NMF37127.1 M24 family metallopeptidase [Flammeovirga yaeyamensis]QWG00818.1 aminopeptidase P N-terminal domain-containing protein [Flammeovirga yaeyamensis]